MKSEWNAIFFVLFFASPSFSQNDQFDQISVDSALIWLHENHVDNPSGFHERALQTLAKTYQLKDDQLAGKAHLLLMRWHAYHVPFTIDSIFDHGEKAVDLFRQIKDEEKLATACAELAFEYIDDNDLKRSEDLIFEAIKIYETLGDENGLGTAYQGLSSIFLAQEESKISIKYGLEALKYAERNNNYQTAAVAWQVLIIAYHNIGETEKAIQAGTKCIEIVENHVPEDVFTLARAYGYRGDVYSDIKNYEKSLEDNIKSYEIVEAHIGAERPAAQTYRRGIGQAYYLQGNYQDALPHLESALAGYIAMGQGRVPKLQSLYNQIADCHSRLGNYKKAFIHQSIEHEIFDTLVQNKIANLEAASLAKYESGKKDQALAEQATIIQQNSRIQWLGAGLIGLLVLFLSTLFYYYRRNQKTSRALQAKNQENELLLKEIHHRVKNNLQTISSLLSLQSESISDQSALDAVQESKNRVASMALIHQKLYQGDNLAAIEMRDYFETIAEAIKDSFGEKAKNVDFEVDMSAIELDVDTAIPIGLITNELLTNSLKYAFKEKQNGKISIKLLQDHNGLLTLRVEDNGIGLTAEALSKKENGFGTLLVQLLTTQLGGTLEKSGKVGVSTVIQFPVQEKSAA